MKHLWLITLMLLPAGGAAPATAQDGVTGLPLPRFVSTRSQPINVRVGPGQRYDVGWVFQVPGLPVEIIQEFDVWRKIRYFDGEEGWIHQSLLSSRRTALVRPWETGTRTALYARPEETAGVRAFLPPGFLVGVEGCSEGWCAVSASGAEPGGRALDLRGHVVQFELWGVYPGEDIK